MLTLPASVRVFVARGATDLRRSFDRLSAQVQEVLRQDPLSGHVFMFFNRQRNRVKLLVWERDGFWLLYKRLEAGTFGCWTATRSTPLGTVPVARGRQKAVFEQRLAALERELAQRGGNPKLAAALER